VYDQVASARASSSIATRWCKPAGWLAGNAWRRSPSGASPRTSAVREARSGRTALHVRKGRYGREGGGRSAADCATMENPRAPIPDADSCAGPGSGQA
jgi:hypothetical protein